MREGAVERLSEAQKAALRLVLQGFEAKEIARLLDVSPGAITERLRAARRTLGVGTSRAAARILAAAEGAAYTPHVDTPIGIAGEMPSRMLDLSITGSAGAGQGGVHLKEEQSPYLVGRLGPQRSFPWPFPVQGRRRNDLTLFETGILILALTIGLGMAALVAVALVDQISRLHG